MPVLRLKNLNSRYLFFVLFVLAIPFFVRFIREEGVQRVLTSVHELKSVADLSIEKFHFTEREKGERKWEIWAERAERFFDKSYIHMDQVRMEYLLDKGGWIRLSGRLGDYFEKQERVEMAGEVQVETDSGYTLYGDRLIWEIKKNLIFSDQPVRLVTDRYVVSGDRISFRTDLNQVMLTGGVRTVISPRAREQGDSS